MNSPEEKLAQHSKGFEIADEFLNVISQYCQNAVELGVDEDDALPSYIISQLQLDPHFIKGIVAGLVKFVTETEPKGDVETEMSLIAACGIFLGVEIARARSSA